MWTTQHFTIKVGFNFRGLSFSFLPGGGATESSLSVQTAVCLPQGLGGTGWPSQDALNRDFCGSDGVGVSLCRA